MRLTLHLTMQMTPKPQPEGMCLYPVSTHLNGRIEAYAAHLFLWPLPHRTRPCLPRTISQLLRVSIFSQIRGFRAWIRNRGCVAPTKASVVCYKSPGVIQLTLVFGSALNSACSLETTRELYQALSSASRGPVALDVDLPILTDQSGAERTMVRVAKELGMALSGLTVSSVTVTAK
jgi:hypothetical protein